MSSSNGFDRLKPRTAPRSPSPAARPDREGKGVLFSPGLFSTGAPAGGPPMLGPLGTVTVRCSACAMTTSLTPLGALRASLPSVHLPVLRREFPSWMRCPACTRRTWVRLGLRLGGP